MGFLDFREHPCPPKDHLGHRLLTFIPVEDGSAQGLSHYRFYLWLVAAGLSTKARVSSGAASAWGDLAPTSPSLRSSRALGMCEPSSGHGEGTPPLLQPLKTSPRETKSQGKHSPFPPRSCRDAQGPGSPQGRELPRLLGWISTPSL